MLALIVVILILLFNFGAGAVVGGAMPAPADSSADKAYSTGRRGHKMETLMLHYINRYADSPFVVGKNIPWLRDQDESAEGGWVSLELDAWNPACRVAFEFNGPVHYRPDMADGSTANALDRWLVGRYNDRIKRRLAATAGVRLYTILPETLTRDYILSRLWDGGCLDKKWLTTDGRHRGFTYLPVSPEPTILHSERIARIRAVRRFGEGSPAFLEHQDAPVA